MFQVVFEAQLCADLTVDDLFGWGGIFPASVAYIWKKMEMVATSGFMNRKGHKRAVAVT